MIPWKRTVGLDELNAFCRGTIHDALGIRFTAIDPEFLEAEMPVDPRTVQPAGFLHGGASVVLAESLGSIASYLCSDAEASAGFGIEVSASHVKSARDGRVIGQARPIHLGGRLHRWEILIRDESGDLICTCRLTVYVRTPGPRRAQGISP